MALSSSSTPVLVNHFRNPTWIGFGRDDWGWECPVCGNLNHRTAVWYDETDNTQRCREHLTIKR
jgi:hypothetical protein